MAPEQYQASQAPRLIEISTPLGPDTLVLRRLRVEEAISRPFLIEADMVSHRDDLKPADLIGQPVTLTVRRHPDLDPRHFHGIVRSFGRGAHFGRGLTSYRLEAVPRLWNASRTADCRIFQAQSIKAIIETVLDENGVAPLRAGSNLPSAPRTYCVQWNETDLDFCARLLDETGCGYFFQHEDGEHTLHLASANADFPPVPGEPLEIRADNPFFDALTEWQPVSGLRPGKVTALDYDLLKPNQLQQRSASTVLSGPMASGQEVFLWPGGQTVRPDAEPASLAMATAEVDAETVRTTGSYPHVFAGGKLKVRTSGAGSNPETFIVTRVVHEATDETHIAGGTGSAYANQIELIPAERAWRNPQPRPRPVVPGVQSAIVTGPAGEELYVDEYGRIKVHFLWDRAGRTDEGSSLWVRVAQPYAGAWGGTWFLPRIGDEVLVAFMDGDPDKPVVVGSLYNGEQKPPVALPGKMLQGGIWTRSSKGGTAGTNANILRFDDTKGSEEVYFQAEYDHNVLVKHDETAEIGNDRKEVVKRDHSETIERDHTTKVTRNLTQTVDGKMDETITGNRTQTIKQGNESLTVQMGNMSTAVKMGNIDTKADLGKITVEAMQSITLKVGQSSVVIDQMGVTIKGMMIKSEAQLMLQTKGLMVQQEASAIHIVKGALVMIN